AYQWQFNEIDISGATNNSLVISNATQTDEGLYGVRVMSYLGSLTSSQTALRLSSVVVWGAADDLQPPVGLTNVTAIAADIDHILALKGDGTVVAWGNWM